MTGEYAYWDSPHWTNRNDYPANDASLPDWRWRWEFLRRDPGYQKAWAMGSETKGLAYRPAHPDDLMKAKLRFRLEKLLPPHASDVGPDDIFGTISRVVHKDKRRIHPYIPELEEHVSVIGRDSTGRATGMMLKDVGNVMKTIGEISVGVSDEFPIVQFYFDVSKPIPPQLEQAKKFLNQTQKRRAGSLLQFRKRQDLWPTYLRLLDAENQGNPRPMVIWRHFLSEAESLDVEAYDRLNVENPAKLISDWQSAAKELRDKAVTYL